MARSQADDIRALEDRLRQRPVVVRAMLKLMQGEGLDEAGAWKRMRRIAMDCEHDHRGDGGSHLPGRTPPEGRYVNNTEGDSDVTTITESFCPLRRVQDLVPGDRRPQVRQAAASRLPWRSPGCTHDYVDSFKDIAATAAPSFITTRSATAKSTHLPEKGGDFWTVDFFKAEMHNLIDHLGIATPIACSASPGAACWVRNSPWTSRRA